ncbi:MAG: hypothetical protein ACUVXF_06055 [Desulfobaccales bacterium]
MKTGIKPKTAPTGIVIISEKSSKDLFKDNKNAVNIIAKVEAIAEIITKPTRYKKPGKNVIRVILKFGSIE